MPFCYSGSQLRADTCSYTEDPSLAPTIRRDAGDSPCFLPHCTETSQGHKNPETTDLPPCSAELAHPTLPLPSLLPYHLCQHTFPNSAKESRKQIFSCHRELAGYKALIGAGTSDKASTSVEAVINLTCIAQMVSHRARVLSPGFRWSTCRQDREMHTRMGGLMQGPIGSVAES